MPFGKGSGLSDHHDWSQVVDPLAHNWRTTVRLSKAATMTRLVDRLDQFAGLPRQLSDHASRLDRLGSVKAVL